MRLQGTTLSGILRPGRGCIKVERSGGCFFSYIILLINPFEVYSLLKFYLSSRCYIEQQHGRNKTFRLKVQAKMGVSLRGIRRPSSATLFSGVIYNTM